MARITIVFGIILILMGVVGYALPPQPPRTTITVEGAPDAPAQITTATPIGEPKRSPTALIPAIFGVVFLVLGAMANKEHLRKHVMHAAVLIALLGFVATVRSWASLPALFAGEAARPAATTMQALMAALMLVYIVLAVRSFIEARKRRTAGL